MSGPDDEGCITIGRSYHRLRSEAPEDKEGPPGHNCVYDLLFQTFVSKLLFKNLLHRNLL